MLFSDLYKSTKLPLSRLRQHPHAAPATSDYDPDLLSKDKIKQKDAVKRFLAARIRNDWEFKWPPPSEPSHTVGTQAGADETVEQGSAGDDAEKEDQATDATDSHEAVDNAIGTDTDSGHDDVSTYSTVSEDPDHFRSRTEWLSDLSDDDEPFSPSAYRFDNPEGVGIAVKANELARSANRRRAARAEMQWNAGLACFNARRDAWTGAKVARVRPKPPSSVPTSPSKRLSFWGRISTPTSPVDAPATSPLSPTATRTSGDTTAVSCSDTDGKEANTKKDSSTYPIQTLLPLAPPILPPANPMRSSITPASYPSIYDKIVVQTMTPACPVNLVDVIRACVTGWKRDGEWPPRSTIVAPVVAVKKKQRRSAVGENDKRDPGRRMSFNFLGRRHSAAGGAVPAGIMHPSQPVKVKDGDKEKENAGGGAKKIFRKSLQRVLGLGLGQDHERARGVDHTNNAGPGPSPGPMTNGI
ncbi:hypothetical protein F4778DRAFT_771710 [Xylariomycetidae sp. FL2044]|nr:hypothetical protein F4778DRAFT_771710 [Xylariomycetidae sp. FL2044]